MRYRFPGSITPSKRPTKTRDQMRYEFQLLKARIPKTMRALRLDAKRLRVLDCD